MEIEFVSLLIIELSRNEFSGDVFFATIGKHLNESKLRNNLKMLKDL